MQARLAAALVDDERWDEAIKVLQVMQFDPYEGERGTRPAYYGAYVGRGLQRYRLGGLSGALGDLKAALAYPRNIGVGKSYYCTDAKAFYWAGVVADELGERERALGFWRDGADLRRRPAYDPDSPKLGNDDEVRYYKSLCLQMVGRAGEAGELF